MVNNSSVFKDFNNNNNNDKPLLCVLKTCLSCLVLIQQAHKIYAQNPSAVKKKQIYFKTQVFIELACESLNLLVKELQFLQ